MVIVIALSLTSVRLACVCLQVSVWEEPQWIAPLPDLGFALHVHVSVWRSLSGLPSCLTLGFALHVFGIDKPRVGNPSAPNFWSQLNCAFRCLDGWRSRSCLADVVFEAPDGCSLTCVRGAVLVEFR